MWPVAIFHHNISKYLYLKGVCLSEAPPRFLSKHAHIFPTSSPQPTTLIRWCRQNKITCINTTCRLSNVLESNNSRVMGSRRGNTTRDWFSGLCKKIWLNINKHLVIAKLVCINKYNIILINNYVRVQLSVYCIVLWFFFKRSPRIPETTRNPWSQANFL